MATRTSDGATVPLEDVQGLVVSGYGRMHHALFLLLRVVRPEAARRWVADLAGRVTASDGPAAEQCVNVAFTADGLRALGLRPAELATFAAPFHEGMIAPHRRRVLADVEASDPNGWVWGGPSGTARGVPAEQIHVLLLLYARDESRMQELEAREVARFTEAGAVEEVRRLTPEPLPGRVVVGGKFGVEHFGFADGMSQPVIQHTGHDTELGGDEARRSVIATGEFVLGYPNGYGELTPWPRLLGTDGDDAFGRNGTYLVLRQLQQDVAGFWSFLRERTQNPDGTPNHEETQRLGAKFVGRWRSGAPLVRAHHRDDPDLGTDNAFAYAAVDPHGERCPLGAHIRRSNPRDSLRSDPKVALELANLHRIVRRGRVYGPELADVFGPDDGQERGLHFMCVNANIERQFEFVQHTWNNNPKFAGLYDERDPIIGQQPAGGGLFTVQDSPFRRRITSLRNFVTVRGGAYFFLPGIRSLQRLGDLARP